MGVEFEINPNRTVLIRQTLGVVTYSIFLSPFEATQLWSELQKIFAEEHNTSENYEVEITD